MENSSKSVNQTAKYADHNKIADKTNLTGEYLWSPQKSIAYTAKNNTLCSATILSPLVIQVAAQCLYRRQSCALNSITATKLDEESNTLHKIYLDSFQIHDEYANNWLFIGRDSIQHNLSGS